MQKTIYIFWIYFQKCACHYQIPVTDCSVVEIPVPSQPKLHKQWCLFDQAENIDFDTEVRKIESNEKRLKEKEQTVKESIFAESTLSDVQFPAKRELGAVLYEDILKLQNIGGYTETRYKQKRHTEHVKKKHTNTNKIVRMSKHVTSQ